MVNQSPKSNEDNAKLQRQKGTMI